MFLSIATTHQPATDLGYLLAKNPAREHAFRLAFGTAHIFFPEATDDSCVAALYVEVDPIGLARRKEHSSYAGAWLGEYINDRPYAASSFLSVAIGRVFGSALAGNSRERPDLANRPIPLKASVSALPCRGSESLLNRLFEPLGYKVDAERLPLDAAFPQWGNSRYFNLRLIQSVRLADLLSHLYVLLPVLDDDKHYWVGDDEVDKLLRRGEGWLASHPERHLIAQRYLRHQRPLYRRALDRLREDTPPEENEQEPDTQEQIIERPLGLHEQRLEAVADVIRSANAASLLDLGCGEGKLIAHVLSERSIRRIMGLDVSSRALHRAAERLKLDRPPARGRVELIQGSLTYNDRRLLGFEAAALVEVIEHIEPDRLDAFEQVLFSHTKPPLVVMTTPNAEYNPHFEGLAKNQLRHPDHRFEWTRAEFEAWCERVASLYGYSVTIEGIGPQDLEAGAPTQMAVFKR